MDIPDSTVTLTKLWHFSFLHYVLFNGAVTVKSWCPTDIHRSLPSIVSSTISNKVSGKFALTYLQTTFQP